MLNATELTSYAGNASLVLTAYGITAPVLLGIVILVWACIKTGSSRVMRAKVWSLIAPNHQHSSARIKQCMGEADDLTHLHLVHGIRLRTKKDYERLMDWMDNHEEGLADVSACGPFFDTQAMGPSSSAPQLVGIVGLAVGFVVAMFLFVAMATLGITAGGLITIKDSGTSYVVSETGILHPAWFEEDRRRVPLSECLGPSKALDAWSLSDRQTLCELVTAPEYAAWLGELLMGQRIVCAVLAAGLCWGAMFMFSLLLNAMATVSMKARLKRRAASAAVSQLPLWPDLALKP